MKELAEKLVSGEDERDIIDIGMDFHDEEYEALMEIVDMCNYCGKWFYVSNTKHYCSEDCQLTDSFVWSRQ